MIKVLVVDDCRTARLAVRAALESDPELLVVAEASTGDETMAAIERYDPDLVTMDVHLGEESGFDVTCAVMARHPRPILMVTAADTSEPELIYRAMANGALEVVSKPSASDGERLAGQRRQLARLVRTLGAVPILHRSRHRSMISPTARPRPKTPRTARAMTRPVVSSTSHRTGVILIGASTGGPPVVISILEGAAPPRMAPIVVVQHISEGFAAGFARWLAQVTPYNSVLVDKPTALVPGVIHVAPDDANIAFTSRGQLAPFAPDNSSRVQPSVDALFQSAARVFGHDVLAVLLTGMGRDGAAGLRSLYECGAITIAQAPETCAVDSMPRAAIEFGAARLVLRPDEISALLRQMFASSKTLASDGAYSSQKPVS
ncbi:MAG: chemotaxis protein CheB [Vicinamibacteria bacterium]|nr:chemotaxis protein CheB [Vicinamibacteria bacterium]